MAYDRYALVALIYVHITARNYSYSVTYQFHFFALPFLVRFSPETLTAAFEEVFNFYKLLSPNVKFEAKADRVS